MISPISSISGVLYRRVAKPMLFRRKPDPVHDGMLRVGSTFQKVRPLMWMTKKMWAYDNRALLQQQVAGLTYKNPLGLSAGLDKNFNICGMIHAIGMGQMEGGSVTLNPDAGNPKPWFHRLPKTKSIVVHAGLPNEGAKVIAKRLANYPSRFFRDMNLNVSVAKSNNQKTASNVAAGVKDYVDAAKIIAAKTPAKIITLNISCPNAWGGELFCTPAPLDKLLTAMDKLALKQKIWLKMPSDLSDAEFRKLLQVVVKHNVAGVTIANLWKGRDTVDKQDNLTDEVKGNLSGKPTFKRSNELIALTYREFGDNIAISGVGGVFTGQDAYTKIRAGASLVQLVTALMFEGPQVVGRINRDLAKLLKRDGFTNVSEAVGLDAEKYLKKSAK